MFFSKEPFYFGTPHGSVLLSPRFPTTIAAPRHSCQILHAPALIAWLRHLLPIAVSLALLQEIARLPTSTRCLTITEVAELRASVVETSASVTELRASAAELRSTVNSLVQIAEIHQRNFEVSQQNFEVMQCNFEVLVSEVRGLRTESQRILEHLFGRQQEEN